MQEVAKERESVRADVAEENAVLYRRFYKAQTRMDKHETAADAPSAQDIAEKELLIRDIETNSRKKISASRKVYYRQSVFVNARMEGEVLAKRAKITEAASASDDRS